MLGTVHIGSDSAEEVKELILTLKPDTVIVEVAPSRLKRLCGSDDPTDRSPVKNAEQQPTTAQTISLLPALAERGWSAGGLTGLVFTVAIMWPSMVKRSLSTQQEEISLPRSDEFAAAVEAANQVGAEIVAADWELDELVLAVSQSMSPLAWMQLFLVGVAQFLKMRPSDPIRRQPGETLAKWSERRRNRETARSSKMHCESVFPVLNSVLVQQRDERFVTACQEAMRDHTGDTKRKVVCVVGLVHLDGIVDML